MTEEFQVEIAESALKNIAAIKDRRIQQLILNRIKDLGYDPIVQGKPLTAELHGLYSVRAVGQRYRIIYQVVAARVVVVMVAVGLRREGDRQDIYSLARRLVQLGLLEKEKDQE